MSTEDCGDWAPKAQIHCELPGTWNLEKLHLELKYLGRKDADARLRHKTSREAFRSGGAVLEYMGRDYCGLGGFDDIDFISIEAGILLNREYEQLDICLHFLAGDISLNTLFRSMNLYRHNVKIHIEGTVSQIFLICFTFCFIKFRKKCLKKNIDVSRFLQ